MGAGLHQEFKLRLRLIPYIRMRGDNDSRMTSEGIEI